VKNKEWRARPNMQWIYFNIHQKGIWGALRIINCSLYFGNLQFNNNINFSSWVSVLLYCADGHGMKPYSSQNVELLDTADMVQIVVVPSLYWRTCYLHTHSACVKLVRFNLNFSHYRHVTVYIICKCTFILIASMVLWEPLSKLSDNWTLSQGRHVSVIYYHTNSEHYNECRSHLSSSWVHQVITDCRKLKCTRLEWFSMA
jgi:hypothetical protein